MCQESEHVSPRKDHWWRISIREEVTSHMPPSKGTSCENEVYTSISVAPSGTVTISDAGEGVGQPRLHLLPAGAQNDTDTGKDSLIFFFSKTKYCLSV